MDLGVEKVELDELFKRADFITLHTPLTEKTKNIIDAAAIAKMKKGVRIINCARGGLVDEQALRRRARIPGMSRARRSTCSSRSRPPRIRCSAIPTWSARRISAPPPPRRRRTSRCRSPSRCRTICCAARSPTRSTSRRSPRRKRRSCKPFIALAEKLGSFAGQLTETGISKVQITYEGAVARDEDQGAHLGRAVAGLLRPMLQRRQRGLGAGRREGARHRGRRDRRARRRATTRA